MTDRILAAARVILRDHGRSLDGCLAVRLEASVVETILRHAGRARHDGFHPTSYDTSPIDLHSLRPYVLRRVLDVRNRRLKALLGVALETRSTVSIEVPETRRGRGLLVVDLDPRTLALESAEAIGLAETHLAIEHRETLRELLNRGGSSLTHLPFDVGTAFAPHADGDQPLDRVDALVDALALMGRWARTVVDAADRAVHPDIVERLDRRARAARGDLAALLREAAAEIRRLRG